LTTPLEVTIHPLRLARPHAAVVLALALLLPLALARAETVHGIPLPRGSRVADPARPSGDLFTSGRGFRDTVEHVRRHLKKTGLAHQEIPIYRRGPVTVARFLARQPGLPWLAIHVFQHTGKTFIAIVPTPPATPTAPPAPGT
jgi:hypothetical protein